MAKILIYGGSGGIGLTTARLVRQQNFEVHLVGRSEDKVAKIAAELNANYTIGDVRENNLFAEVAKDAGESLSGLIYAVGTLNLGKLQKFTEFDFIEDLRINAIGAALAVKSALPALNKSENVSSVVLFSSVAALQGFSFHASMGMAKGAVSGLTLSLAAELAPKVRVNAIAPSLTRTPLADSILSREMIVDALSKQHPLKRLGTPEDIAKLAAFLVSLNSDWITGQIISADGGRSTIQTK